ncbi:hypothetical protein BDZ85DRAFT_41785 [Elsinoe ampelina]|uniref:Uncharacterized protein n=1 Tax=Elsinoe ampelina TaxID=302913 RepID=A0A6A6G0Z6_9PEZI|nr:hypothetical protein BDZ85DRAFT_41785 [Elsinoe ampelina]
MASPKASQTSPPTPTAKINRLPHHHLPSHTNLSNDIYKLKMPSMAFEQAFAAWEKSYAELRGTSGGDPTDHPAVRTETREAWERGEMSKEEFTVLCLAEIQSHTAWIRVSSVPSPLTSPSPTPSGVSSSGQTSTSAPDASTAAGKPQTPPKTPSRRTTATPAPHPTLCTAAVEARSILTSFRRR